MPVVHADEDALSLDLPAQHQAAYSGITGLPSVYTRRVDDLEKLNDKDLEDLLADENKANEYDLEDSWLNDGTISICSSPRKGSSETVNGKTRRRAFFDDSEASNSDDQVADGKTRNMTASGDTESCAFKRFCRKPQYDKINWVQCDECDEWFHNLCILGTNKEVQEEEFHCGCARKLSKG
ncbi:transcription factor 19-like protein [Aphelenchoides avenae]|nr:transcription factor 19-like protein [Aphelenchus avenae]